MCYNAEVLPEDKKPVDPDKQAPPRPYDRFSEALRGKLIPPNSQEGSYLGCRI